jgi:endogenous inhibitor of DNA gyrase (YacG/DUF329 family)
MTTSVSCPVCRKAVAWLAGSTWRPFCSERCRLIDLGDWAAERHVIAGRAADVSDDVPGTSDQSSDAR